MHTFLFQVDFGQGLITMTVQCDSSQDARQIANAQWGGTAKSITFLGIK